ncbi:MAG TPA: CHC2 zinc finger domain-containing protein [Roseiarcus sp.]|nr:CHC2 zinc finger domain-containing protein [Roseiarcus sp.]
MSIPSHLIDSARNVDILAVAQARTSLKRVAPNEYAGPCPACDGHDRFAVNTRNSVFNCRGCGAKGKGAIDLVMHVDGCDFREAVERLAGRVIEARPRPSTVGEAHVARAAAKAAPEAAEGDTRALAIAANIVAKMRPLAGTPGEAYLRDVRKIDVSEIKDVLERADAIGWHPAVYFNEPGHPLHGQRLGCIIGVMTDAKTAQPTGAISRTYLAPDGTKIGKAKTLGAPAGIVRLTPDEDVLAGLFLAEGIETALDGMSRGLRPMWSTGSTGLMKSFPVLAGIESLNVIVDHDLNSAGERAAREVEARWRAAGKEVNLYLPNKPGDLNDMSRGGAQ